VLNRKSFWNLSIGADHSVGVRGLETASSQTVNLRPNKFGRKLKKGKSLVERSEQLMKHFDKIIVNLLGGGLGLQIGHGICANFAVNSMAARMAVDPPVLQANIPASNKNVRVRIAELSGKPGNIKHRFADTPDREGNFENRARLKTFGGILVVTAQ
jgi:hypothetical protein